MVLEGAAVGEEVSANVIREYRRYDDRKLTLIRSQGISDQRVALINTILAERQTGTQVPEK